MSRDACQVCRGTRGGVPGNENTIDGRVLCDYCHATQATMLPCPFCGGKALLDADERYPGGNPAAPDALAYFARCRSCAAQGPWSKAATGALRGWNSRVEP